MTELVVSTEPNVDPAVFRVAGEIDLASGPTLSEALDLAFAAGASSLHLDFTEVTYMDSTGLGVLAIATDRAAGVGGTVRVEGASPLVRRLLEISQLDTVISLD